MQQESNRDSEDTEAMDSHGINQNPTHGISKGAKAASSKQVQIPAHGISTGLEVKDHACLNLKKKLGHYENGRRHCSLSCLPLTVEQTMPGRGSAQDLFAVRFVTVEVI